MVSFTVPVGGGGPGFRFSVQELGVLFAGSRHGEVPPRVCGALIGGLARDGFSFWVGCASGVDRSFRKALSTSEYADRTFVGCAFRCRERSLSNYGLLPRLWCQKVSAPKQHSEDAPCGLSNDAAWSSCFLKTLSREIGVKAQSWCTGQPWIN
jgi:hypothetical protein